MTRIPLGTIVSRAARLRCPRCGQGKLFRGWFRMHGACPHCQLRYERAPGYFLGSAYINYAATALLVTAAYVSLHYGAELTNRQLTAPLVALCVAFPLFFFRYARSWWLAMDCYLDPTAFEPDELEQTEAHDS
ncbi:MAG TPA: DUF983 domain-containing protein [Planctomycetaceae bacterium]|nr:DUF983 domain-containing protein [Planctomycetaceae bacterium]